MSEIQTVNSALRDTQGELKQLIADILKQAAARGASSADVAASQYTGYQLAVRMGEVETLEYNQDKGIGITVYFGQCKGSASTTDTRPEEIAACVEKACQFARYTEADPFAGLADKSLMATDYPDLDLCHPWSLDPEAAIPLAIEAEKIALNADNRIVNSEGVSISTHYGVRAYGNSHGFIGAYSSSLHAASCVLIAKDKQGMQRDYEYTEARDPASLESLEYVAGQAVDKTIKRLGARRLPTQKVPVIFKASVARGLLAHFVAAIQGASIYRQSSFLLDKLNQQIFAPKINIYEDPHLAKAIGSAPYDSEGVRTSKSDIVVDGILQHYLLGSYSARKLGMQSTGNAGGVHNLMVGYENIDLAGLLKEMGRGLLVTELMGQGINIVTGDYSRGASGFWVENGEIQYPVEEITVASNLADMFMNIQRVANDVDHRGNIKTGSILIGEMTVAGE